MSSVFERLTYYLCHYEQRLCHGMSSLLYHLVQVTILILKQHMGVVKLLQVRTQ
jgi:hypothetical protein